MFLSSCISSVPDHLVSAWSFGFVFKGVLGIGGLKARIWGLDGLKHVPFFLLSSCSFLLVSQITWFLSSCMGSWGSKAKVGLGGWVC